MFWLAKLSMIYWYIVKHKWKSFAESKCEDIRKTNYWSKFVTTLQNLLEVVQLEYLKESSSKHVKVCNCRIFNVYYLQTSKLHGELSEYCWVGMCYRPHIKISNALTVCHRGASNIFLNGYRSHRMTRSSLKHFLYLHF